MKEFFTIKNLACALVAVLFAALLFIVLGVELPIFAVLILSIIVLGLSPNKQVHKRDWIAVAFTVAGGMVIQLFVLLRVFIVL